MPSLTTRHCDSFRTLGRGRFREKRRDKPARCSEGVNGGVNGDTVYVSYDVNCRITSVTTNGNLMTCTYDYLGRVITKQDFEGSNTIIDYDHLGRATKVRDPWRSAPRRSL